MTQHRPLLIRNPAIVVTMDDADRELEGTDILVRDGGIAGLDPERWPEGTQIIDASDCVVTPGLVNTHHHMFQSLTRTVPGGQDALLFGWLQRLYPIWARMGPDDIRIATKLALSELALSGCTQSSDHLYLLPNGARLDDSIDAAREVGLRFHATRGSMSIGESAGGLPPDALVEDERAILEDSIRLIDRYHDPDPGAMLRIGLAPCSPFSVSRELMRDTANLARDKGVRLHTHLAENDEDVAYSLDTFGCRPGVYAQDLGWTGDDVWHAHCVKLDASEIDLFARSGTAVAHCPCSNCRLGSGIAPVRAMLDAGVRVGLGVDGSASNDSGHMLAEAREAMLMQRVANGADALSARQALRIATRGGAEALGREDCGSIEVGKRADIAIWTMNDLQLAGAWDPVAALVLCGPPRVRTLIVDGVERVRDGQLVSVDTEALVSQVREAVQQLMA